METNKVALSWPNVIDKTSLSGGSYLSTLPLSNAQNRLFSKKARTINLNTDNTRFDIYLSGGFKIQVLAIAAHNFSVNSRIRIRMYKTNDLIFDSNEIPVWRAIYTAGSLDWESNSYWTNTLSQDEINDYTKVFSIVMNAGEYPYPDQISVDVYDSENPDGYIEFGRLFVGSLYQPNLNFSLGAEMGYSVNTQIEESINGVEYFDVKTPRRTASFTLDALTEEEAYGEIYRMRRILGVNGEMFFSYFNREDEFYQIRTFIGRFQQIDPISQPYNDRFNTSFNLIEII